MHVDHFGKLANAVGEAILLATHRRPCASFELRVTRAHKRMLPAKTLRSSLLSQSGLEKIWFRGLKATLQVQRKINPGDYGGGRRRRQGATSAHHRQGGLPAEGGGGNDTWLPWLTRAVYCGNGKVMGIDLWLLGARHCLDIPGV